MDNQMASYIFHRLIRALITLVVFQTILFLLIHALPWDSVNLVRVPPIHQRAIRHVLGLDQPVWKQYFLWMRGFFTADLGQSLQLGRTPVMSIFIARIPKTLILFLPGALLGFSLGLWLGKLIAWRRGGGLEVGATIGGVIFYTAFAPWLAFVLVAVFALSLQWVPSENIINPNLWSGTDIRTETIIWWILLTLIANFILALIFWRLTRQLSSRHLYRLGALLLLSVLTAYLWVSSGWTIFALDILHHLTLPLVTLILLTFGETMLLMRATMIDVLTDDHVITARAKGLKDHKVRDKHVARLAILPILARFIVQLPLIIIGSFVLERVFFWQGMGEMLFRAVDTLDVPVILGVLSLVGILMLLAHLVFDILVAWLDPRLREVYVLKY
jgi:peptide/nickel transport system permease protein